MRPVVPSVQMPNSTKICLLLHNSTGGPAHAETRIRCLVPRQRGDFRRSAVLWDGAVTRSGCVCSEGQGDGQGQGQGQGPRESGGRWTGTARATRTGSDRRSGQRAFDLQPIGLPCSREYCVVCVCVCVPAECVQCVVVVLHTPKAALGNGAGSKAGWLCTPPLWDTPRKHAYITSRLTKRMLRAGCRGTANRRSSNVARSMLD